MPKHSPTQTCIFITCSPEQYVRFYSLKKRLEQVRRVKQTNREFLDLLLRSFEERLRIEEESKTIRSY
jgi:predicted Ser/Thr protein kinase